MKQKDGCWSAPPPTYDCIVRKKQSTVKKRSTPPAAAAANTLWGYMTMSNEEVAAASASSAALNGSMGTGEQNGEKVDGVTDETAPASTTTIFGSIYSLSQLRQRFG